MEPWCSGSIFAKPASGFWRHEASLTFEAVRVEQARNSQDTWQADVPEARAGPPRVGGQVSL